MRKTGIDLHCLPAITISVSVIRAEIVFFETALIPHIVYSEEDSSLHSHDESISCPVCILRKFLVRFDSCCTDLSLMLFFFFYIKKYIHDLMCSFGSSQKTNPHVLVLTIWPNLATSSLKCPIRSPSAIFYPNTEE